MRCARSTSLSVRERAWRSRTAWRWRARSRERRTDREVQAARAAGSGRELPVDKRRQGLQEGSARGHRAQAGGRPGSRGLRDDPATPGVSSTVRILTGPSAHAALLRGVDRMARLLRPTLGPLPRTVAVDRITSTSRRPEILESGAAIVGRTIQLADPFENMGAMLLRHVARRVFERAGDGTTTAPGL